MHIDRIQDSTTTHRLPQPGRRHGNDDLQDLAEQLSGMRALLLEALTMLADRERRLKRSRECYARLRDENRGLRASIMQADMGRAA